MPVVAGTTVHLLAAAGWTGAMGYSLLVVQPRAAAFFGVDDDSLEAFVATPARRQRWPVIGALVTTGATGVTLAVLARPQPTPAACVVAVAVQSVALAVAGGLFPHVSWHLWPARVFALPAERAAFSATVPPRRADSVVGGVHCVDGRRGRLVRAAATSNARRPVDLPRAGPEPNLLLQ